jgi:hypothetical protein
MSTFSTPFIVPGFQCWQSADLYNNGSVAGVDNNVNLFRSKDGRAWIGSGGTPSGIVLKTESGRNIFLADYTLTGGTQMEASYVTPGHLSKFHFLGWVKAPSHTGAFSPISLSEWQWSVGGHDHYITLGTLNGNLSIQGRFAYHVLPSTTGTRSWSETEVGPFGAWYLVSMEINEAAAAYRLRVYNTSGTLLVTVNTSSAVPAGARMRFDAGNHLTRHFGASDGGSLLYFGLQYERKGDTFTDAQIASIIAAGFGQPVDPAPDIAPIQLTYDPLAPAPAELQEVRIYCGSGANIKFSPATPTPIAASEYWEVRVGQLYSSASEPPTILSYTAIAGNLTVNTDTGDIVADLAANETEDLDPSPSVRTFVELWRIGVGDDNTGPVARAIARVIDTVRPAP